MSRVIHLKTAILKAAVVLVPSYLAAYLTDKMVWVVPTLAASSFFAATIGLSNEQTQHRVDENDAGDSSEETEAENIMPDFDG